MNININDNYYSFQALKPVKVNDKLIRGGATISPRKIKKMKKEGVTQIIDLRNSALFERPIEKLLCRIFGIKYINYKFSHRAKNIPGGDFFEKINQAIINNQGTTYLHCEYGKHNDRDFLSIYKGKNL